jgi:hypothetical protein
MKSVKALKSNSKRLHLWCLIYLMLSKSASPNQAELPPQDSLQRSLEILTTQVLKTIPSVKENSP